MPWKDRYTISDEKSLLDSEVTLAGRQALLLPHRRRPRPALRARRHHAPGPHDAGRLFRHAWRAGGARSSVLNRYGLKATFAVPAVIAEIHADTIRALARRAATRSPRTASSTRM